MPRVLSYTPAWLSRTAPGFRLFSNGDEQNQNAASSKSLNGDSDTVVPSGHRRTIEHRGSEVFVAVGTDIRWADLASIKDSWESRSRSRSELGKQEAVEQEDDDLIDDLTVRVLKLQYVKEPIQQLVRSPNNDLLAVVTDHTVHICILPDPSHLEQPDTGPIRPKTQFLGHTTHVLSESRVASVLWHPLGANGSCLVTVTEDAVVRLWELNMENRWSSEHPTVAVDLRKLQYARSYEDDIQPAKMGDNRGFSTDAFGMEVASACFGGRGTEEEAGWSAMTLWVAMTEGDVYALCPLLPSKWQPPPSLIPSLTTSIQAQRSFLEASQATVAEKENCEQQYAWLAEIDREEPMLIQGKTEFSDPVPVYRRPKILKSVPQLQGPFVINPGDVGENLDIADIQVVAPTIDTEDLYAGEDEFTANAQGLSSSLVCLLSGSGRVYVCLDLTGVEAQWLPMKKPNLRSRQFEEPQELIILEAVDTVASQGSEKIFGEPPMLTADFHSRYAFFITHGFGVFYLSLNALVQQLDKEIQAENIAGLQVRMNVVMDRSNVLREQMLRFREEDNKRGLSAPAIMQDSDLGYFLLTTCDGLPHAAILDQPREYSESPEREFIALPQREELATQVPVADPRPAYQPPESLYQPLSLRTFVDTRTNSRYKHTLKDEIRLSAATLEIMTEAHRVISKETFDMGKGVSDLFARCDRMRHELRNQIQSVREIAEKVDHINEEDTDDLETEARARGREKLDERLQRVKERYTELTVRHKGLKKKLAQTGARPLSEKEQAWSREVEKLGKALLSPEHEEEEEEEGSERAAKEIGQEYWKRFEEAQELAGDLIAQAKEETEENVDAEKGDDRRSSSSFRVPPDIRQKKLASVMGLLDRESALVHATQQRLERLSLA